MTKRIASVLRAVLLALLTLALLAYASFAAATKHYDWLYYVSIPMIVLYAIFFVAEIVDLKQLMIKMTHREKNNPE